MREWVPDPTPFPRIDHQGVTRVLAADLVGEEPVRESITAPRTEIKDLAARLDAAEAIVATLPHRRKYLALTSGSPAGSSTRTCRIEESSANSHTGSSRPNPS